MLSIVAALEPELDGLGSALNSLWLRSGDAARQGQPAPFRTAVIGMSRHAADNLGNLLAQWRQTGPNNLDVNNLSDVLLLVGSAGALTPELNTGDLTLPTRYYVHAQDTEPDGVQPVAQGDFAEPDGHWWRLARQAARRAGPGSFNLDSVTTTGLVAEPAERAELGQRYAAGIVDLEDYWVAQAAARHGMPLVVARVVLDTVGQRLPSYLPSLSRLGSRAALTVASHPWDVPALLKLARQTRQAQRTLAWFVQAFAPLVWGLDINLDNWAATPGIAWE